MFAKMKTVGRFFLLWGKKLYDMYLKHPIAFCIVTGIIVEIYIEFFSRHSFTSGFKFIFGSPLVFLYNCLIIIFTLLISVVVKRGIACYVTALLIWIGFGTANAIILLERSIPFSFSDILLLPSVIKIINVYLEIHEIIIIVAAILAAIAAIVFLWIKGPKRKINIKRDVTALVASAVLVGVGTPIGLAIDYSDIIAGYNNGGFPYSFAKTLLVRSMSEPDEYDKDSVSAVLAKIENEKSKDTSSDFDENDAPNIIFVQLESFFDINAVKNATFSEDPIPNFTKLKSEYPSGFLNVPVVGSGTIDTEFEILTGMNIDDFPLQLHPLANLLTGGLTGDSMAYVLSSKGYSTHAMHNHVGTFYARYKGYPNIGFDTFTPVENMCGIERNALNWAKDNILTDEIRYAMESTEGKDFVFAVSVQPHGEYPTKQIEGYEYGITVSGISDEELYHKYSYYVNEIHETDKMIKELTDYYANCDEKTVIVFYGDHLPDIKLTNDDLSRGDIYSTEYIIWSNYGLGSDVKDDHETLEAYQLYSYVFDLLGIKDGVMNGIHRYLSDSENYENIIKLIEYDTFYGERYLYEEYKCERTDIKFGIRKVSISGAEIGDDGTLTVYGENFNEFSVIYVNGKSYDTSLLSSGKLICYGVRKADEWSVVVKQEAEKVFGETSEYVLKK